MPHAGSSPEGHRPSGVQELSPSAPGHGWGTRAQAVAGSALGELRGFNSCPSKGPSNTL